MNGCVPGRSGEGELRCAVSGLRVAAVGVEFARPEGVRGADIAAMALATPGGERPDDKPEGPRTCTGARCIGGEVDEATESAPRLACRWCCGAAFDDWLLAVRASLLGPFVCTAAASDAAGRDWLALLMPVEAIAAAAEGWRECGARYMVAAQAVSPADLYGCNARHSPNQR